MKTFTTVRSEAEDAELAAMRTAYVVQRRLLGQAEPQVPAFTGTKGPELIKHRMNEVDRWYDPQFPSEKSARWIMIHHAENALRHLIHYCNNWQDENGIRRIGQHSARAQRVILSLRERIAPATEVARREFDPQETLKAAYDEMELKYLSAISASTCKTPITSKSKRALAANDEMLKTEKSLNLFRNDLEAWVSELKAANELH